MVYGLISLRIHKSLSFGAAIAALAAFAAVMLVCAVAKESLIPNPSSRVSDPESRIHPESRIPDP
jgi:hypothetical protein